MFKKPEKDFWELLWKRFYYGIRESWPFSNSLFREIFKIGLILILLSFFTQFPKIELLLSHIIYIIFPGTSSLAALILIQSTAQVLLNGGITLILCDVSIWVFICIWHQKFFVEPMLSRDFYDLIMEVEDKGFSRKHKEGKMYWDWDEILNYYYSTYYKDPDSDGRETYEKILHYYKYLSHTIISRN